MSGRGLGFHLCVLDFGWDGYRLEPARNGFRVVGGIVSFLSLSGLAWAGSGLLRVARGGVSPPCVCPSVHLGARPVSLPLLCRSGSCPCPSGSCVSSVWAGPEDPCPCLSPVCGCAVRPCDS